MKLWRSVLLIFSLSISLVVKADELTIQMLNAYGTEKMVYDIKIANINLGDTIHWISIDKGHNVEFIKKGVPEGVGKFKSKVGKNTSYTFSIPGIYAYQCTPHKTLGMIGFVVVGSDYHNLENIRKLKFLGKSKKVAKPLLETITADASKS